MDHEMFRDQFLPKVADAEDYDSAVRLIFTWLARLNPSPDWARLEALLLSTDHAKEVERLALYIQQSLPAILSRDSLAFGLSMEIDETRVRLDLLGATDFDPAHPDDANFDSAEGVESFYLAGLENLLAFEGDEGSNPQAVPRPPYPAVQTHVYIVALLALRNLVAASVRLLNRRPLYFVVGEEAPDVLALVRDGKIVPYAEWKTHRA